MATKKNANIRAKKAAAGVDLAGDSLDAKFARNAPNGNLTKEEEYFQQNTSNRAEVAYMVNNGQLTVADLPKDFDVSLLSESKRAELEAATKE